MSGTSADGIDVALVRIREGADGAPSLRFLAHEGFPFSAALRKAVLGAMNAQVTSTAELARLNWRLGLAYAEAVRTTLESNPMKLDLVGCHGQTLYHQAMPIRYAGSTFACTWQAGEPAILAGELGVPVVSNFRPADMVAGGLGAPLVPLLDFVLFRHAKRGRVLQNIGGIGNLTSIPAGATVEQVQAFDTGPGNMVIDTLMFELYGKRMDLGGAVAATGRVLTPVLERALRNPFLRKLPPKAAGREQFGREFAAAFLSDCRKISKRKQDAIATASAFTVASIARAYRDFVAERMGSAAVDYIVAGGGARNMTLMRQLADALNPYRCHVSSIDDFGMPAEAKEAAAFALLAWQTWMHRPGNIPSATGANRPAVLGQVTYV
ncbi:anhydro-N-acetylmuramic acid kinase [Acidicapsa ligni]|uniref:anhydro-N-acetylmuramic acid kinase n=1 Tax=Acidicapsa ligni TaxID=542300 RepID=UPI0021DF5ADE|nr:anhydro-N-acetylmuramic acid kinase [Acidicapsa ligni]